MQRSKIRGRKRRAVITSQHEIREKKKTIGVTQVSKLLMLDFDNTQQHPRIAKYKDKIMRCITIDM